MFFTLKMANFSIEKPRPVVQTLTLVPVNKAKKLQV